MKHLKLFFVLSYFFVVSHIFAAESATWFRSNAISPDGQTIVFTYKGDLFTVSSNGGRASRLTSNKAYDGFPCWSPDGQTIAFSSDRYGNMDVFTISRNGGTPKRLTTHSADEYVQTFLDKDHILYSAAIQADVKDIQYPSGFTQVWQVDLSGHRPILFSSLTMEAISINADGKLLYQNKKGYEDDWRKHHRSPITRDIYLSQTDKTKRTYCKLNTDNAEHRNPVWAPDGKSFYFLSEKNGTMNLYKRSILDTTESQITHYAKYPVRYLSVANNGTICYSWDGDLYTIKNNGNPQKLDINIITDDNEDIIQPQTVNNGITTFDIAKNEKEIAFTLNGDIYTKTMDYETTKQITHTAEAEEAPSFSPDGRTIVYCAERNGQRNLYWTKLVAKNDKYFTYATDFKEEQLTTANEPCIMPKFSPDGKKIAFIANRSELRVMDVKSRTINVALPAKYNFSYSDGDIDFEWSPDSRWLLTSYMGENGWNNMDVAVVSADGKKVVDLTNSGYSDQSPMWALGGKAIVWASDRTGYRSHGSWGTENDAFIMFLDRDLYEKASLNKEDRTLYELRAKIEKDSTTTKNKKDNKIIKEKKSKTKISTKSKKETKNLPTSDSITPTDSIKPLKLDFEDCEDRIIRLTINSSFLNNMFLSPDGKNFYYASKYEDDYDLWVHDLEKNTTRILKKHIGAGTWIPDTKGTSLYICNGSLSKIDLTSGDEKPLPFKADVQKETASQREFIYDHCIHQILNRFCDINYHGIDFKALAKHYRKFLPNIGNSRDLSEMVSELLGELNCSHTGLKYRPVKTCKSTPYLGAFFDEKYKGDGLRIQEVVKNGPLDLPTQNIKAGCIIKEINHNKILEGQDYYPLLTGKENQWVLLTLTDEKDKNTFETYVKPISGAKNYNLLYKRWVDRAAQYTKEYSKGKIGYVHLEDMDSKSFRNIYSEILGKYRNCKALVVDERHNGGGWLHDDLGILLSGKQFQTYSSRGQVLGHDPFSRWNNPSCVLVCEDCYSNAHGFPAMYKALGLGKLVGSSMAGTMTAVWWENEIDPNLIEGLPEVNCIDMKGIPCENQQLNPDIQVELTPTDQISGNDTQLRKAIDYMLSVSK